MNHTYHFTRASGNVKTGPIPVTTTSSDSCPPTCSFKGNGCYAEAGPLAMHWRAVSAGKRGGTLDELCEKIAALPRNQLWRHNQAGDLPGVDGVIDAEALAKIVAANKGRRGFTYTHYLPTEANKSAVDDANEAGFTINWSAETLEEVDVLMAMGRGPVVCVLPPDATTPVSTPRGNFIIVCPAAIGNTDCLNCGICQKSERGAVVGFPAHGSGKARIHKVFTIKSI